MATSLPDSSESTRSEEVRAAVDAIDRGWRSGHPQALAELFDENVVIATLGGSVLARGRAPCVQSYVDFVRASRILDYRPADASVEVWGDTAVTRRSFAIRYETEGATYDEQGFEIFVMRRCDDGAWRACWRAVDARPAKHRTS
ncbi:MAG: nuclear transport factor 2 family protein [Planctomycetes bacterium]|nr:nuclear transport factor 2 family protein [Planctomycetota bacterium]